MTDPITCRHATLQFGSGDYYIFCHACGKKWAIVGDREYGIDKDGNHVGAAPELQGHQNPDLSSERRVLP